MVLFLSSVSLDPQLRDTVRGTHMEHSGDGL